MIFTRNITREILQLNSIDISPTMLGGAGIKSIVYQIIDQH